MSELEDLDGNIRVCDCCEIEDGRRVLTWQEKDFDLCLNCLEGLYIEHFDPKNKRGKSYKCLKLKVVII